MTPNEGKRLAAMVQSLFMSKNKQFMPQQLALYVDVLSSFPIEASETAIRHFMRTGAYVPAAGEVADYVRNSCQAMYQSADVKQLGYEHKADRNPKPVTLSDDEFDCFAFHLGKWRLGTCHGCQREWLKKAAANKHIKLPPYGCDKNNGVFA